MCNVPETTYPKCSDSQLSPPTSGLIHSDHRKPGSAVSRFTVAVPRCTTLAVSLVGVWRSSGVSMLLDSTLAILVLPSCARGGTHDPLPPRRRQGPIGAARRRLAGAHAGPSARLAC